MNWRTRLHLDLALILALPLSLAGLVGALLFLGV